MEHVPLIINLSPKDNYRQNISVKLTDERVNSTLYTMRYLETNQTDLFTLYEIT